VSHTQQWDAGQSDAQQSDTQRSGQEQWDQVVDVVVIGSGAAGLAAATMAADGGSSVVVLERADRVGGTTGVSGGMPWVPLNRHMADVDVSDSREEALAYIRRLTVDREPSADLVETYVDNAWRAIDYLEDHTPVRFSAPPMFADYYADLPGGKPCGRSIEPLPFPAAAELGSWAALVRSSPIMPRLTMEEGGRYLAYGETPDLDLVARREGEDIRVLGSALAAALLKGVLDRGVAVRTGVRARELVSRGDVIVGVRAEVGDEPLSVGARRGVVLACGGFEWNAQMVQAFIGHALEPLSPPGNEGDGHVMAMQAGAVLANMWTYWGQPAMLDPAVTYEGRPALQFSTGRNLPGSIIVNKRGERFVNEGASYQDMPRAFGTYDPVAIGYPNEAPVWMVFDHRLRESTMILSLVPGGPVPEWVVSAPTVGGLAQKIDVDPGALQRTLDRFNIHAAHGEDPDFHRGTLWWEAFMSGGPSAEKCVGPVEQAPFYAVQIHDGTLGTQGGPLVDQHARVLRYRGGVVEGLYAAGNASACVFGPAYPGGGATLGPALTFGYLAGRHAATRAAQALGESMVGTTNGGRS
jgi:3-oxosteroid 1-dehydrogenase